MCIYRQLWQNSNSAPLSPPPPPPSLTETESEGDDACHKTRSEQKVPGAAMHGGLHGRMDASASEREWEAKTEQAPGDLPSRWSLSRKEIDIIRVSTAGDKLAVLAAGQSSVSVCRLNTHTPARSHHSDGGESPSDGATRGVTVSMSAVLACHQCYCAGSSLAWGLNLRAVVCGIFFKLVARGFLQVLWFPPLLHRFKRFSQ